VIYAALLLFFVFEYVRPGAFFPPLNLLRLNTVIPGVLVVANSFSSNGVPHGKVLREANLWMLVFLLGLIGVSVLTADVTLYSFTVWTTVLGYVLIAWVLCRQLTDRSRLIGVLAVLILVHVLVAALTPQMITNPGVRHYLGSGSFLGDGNDFALSVNMAIPLCVFLAFESRRWGRRLLFLAILLFLVFCVVATQSRGGTVALACLGAYYWLRSDKKIVTGAVVAMAVALVFLTAPESYWERMNKINTEEGSAKGRILAWQAGTRMAADHPILGVGAGHFGVKYGVEYRPPTGERVPWQTAHSIYFLALGELGYPGLFVLVALILSNLAANRRIARRLAGRSDAMSRHDRRLMTSLSAAMMAFAVNGAFLSATYYPHLYVLAGLHSAARRLVREGLEEEQPADSALAEALR
jgi:probable O-glycosylation ligase (exosortase A-associated)